ncbi:MAG: dihydroorotate dehydrogenase [Bdellovibrionota bacterium]
MKRRQSAKPAKSPKAPAPDLSVKVGKLSLRNPILGASGCVGYGEELLEFFNPEKIGGIVAKSISLKPRLGNPTPRIVETASGMLNSIGIQSVGVESFLKDHVPHIAKYDTAFVASIFDEREDDYCELARILDKEEAIDGIEVNLSCPNVERGGITFGVEPALAASLIEKVRKATSKPLWAKLSPNVTDVRVIARACVDAGADALSLINTITSMAIDWRARRPILARNTGGLSGPAIKPVALRMVSQVHEALPEVPLVGIGGIASGEDVCEFLVAGASAVQVGTANYANPRALPVLVEELSDCLRAEKIARAADLTGTLRLNSVPSAH